MKKLLNIMKRFIIFGIIRIHCSFDYEIAKYELGLGLEEFVISPYL